LAQISQPHGCLPLFLASFQPTIAHALLAESDYHIEKTSFLTMAPNLLNKSAKTGNTMSWQQQEMEDRL